MRSVTRCHLRSQLHFLPDYLHENIWYQSFVLKSEIPRVLSGKSMTSSGERCFQDFVFCEKHTVLGLL